MMAIKASGGITFAQDNETAKYDGMPRSAVAAGCIDFVLSPKDIGRELARLGNTLTSLRSARRRQADSTPANDEALARILTLLRNATGVDFAYYKPTTIRRRILRRMALQRVDSLSRYVNKLRSDPAELNTLYEDILINVTEFFRDPEVFERLKKVVFPKLAGGHDSGPIRIWVPGCSSGEEVYSIAMALLDSWRNTATKTGCRCSEPTSASPLWTKRAPVFTRPASRTTCRPPDCDGSSPR